MSKYSKWRVAIHYISGKENYVVYRKKKNRLPDMKDEFIVQKCGEYPERDQAETMAAKLNEKEWYEKEQKREARAECMKGWK